MSFDRASISDTAFAIFIRNFEIKFTSKKSDEIRLQQLHTLSGQAETKTKTKKSSDEKRNQIEWLTTDILLLQVIRKNAWPMSFFYESIRLTAVMREGDYNDRFKI
jgi:hypothetical protein